MIQKTRIKLKSRFSEFSRLTAFLEAQGKTYSIDPDIIFQINLSLEEIFNNILLYGYKGQQDREVSFNFTGEDNKLKIEIVDEADRFNPLEVAPPNVESPLEQRVPGGLGIHFVRTLMDEVSYKRENNKNILTAVKHLAKQKKKGDKHGN